MAKAQILTTGWMASQLRLWQAWIAQSQVLALLIVVNVAAYFAGLIFWYGYVMALPSTPWWAWPFIPDCPLFALLGAIGLLMGSMQRYGTEQDRQRGRRWLWIAAVLSALIWLYTYLPQAGNGWVAQRAMFALWSGSLVVAACWFHRPPAWLLGIFALGQIKYGIWTIMAWTLYWRSTAEVLGTPHFSADSVLMTVTHIGLAAQGLLLLAYFRPTVRAGFAALAWFGVSDFMDYGLGFYPAIPEELVSLQMLQWAMIMVTLVGSLSYILLGLRRRLSPARLADSQDATSYSEWENPTPNPGQATSA